MNLAYPKLLMFVLQNDAMNTKNAPAGRALDCSCWQKRVLVWLSNDSMTLRDCFVLLERKTEKNKNRSHVCYREYITNWFNCRLQYFNSLSSHHNILLPHESTHQI